MSRYSSSASLENRGPGDVIADALDEVYTLTGDIMEELTDSSSTMEKIDYPHTNPHTAAEDSGKAAQDRADALRTLIQDDH